MSAGIGPPCDVCLPGNEHASNPAATKPAIRRRGFFTTHHLNSLAVAFILSSSGMIGAEDFAFVVFSALYLWFLSKLSFPSTSSEPPPMYGEKDTILRLYLALGSIIGLILPAGYIVTSIVEGDKEGIKAAASPIFLMACQVLLEGASHSGRFSLPVRVFVPILYNSWRMPGLLAWVSSEFAKPELGRNRAIFGRGLAVLNMGLWGFNLVGFLLPFYLPKALKMYYSTPKNESKED